MRIAIVFCALVCATSALTTVHVYEHQNFGGDYATCSNLEDYSHYYFGHMDNKVTSARISQGSCARLHEFDPPAGQQVVISYPHREYSNLGTCCNFNDILSAVEPCSRTSRTSSCPESTFVKRFASTHDNNRLSKFSAQCYQPNNNINAAETLTSHPDVTETGDELRCFGAVRALNYDYDEEWEAYYNTNGNCAASGVRACGHNEAVCGFTTVVEDHTNIIKDISVDCCDVGDPAVLCDPTDFFRPVMVCDALEALAPTTCTYSQKIGRSQSITNTNETANELQFYEEIGFDFALAGRGLSANFHYNVSTSNTTSFNWETAASDTWTSEVTNVVSMEIPPCMKTELFQVEGTCSFFSAKVNHFKRVDTACNGKRIETMVSGVELFGERPSSIMATEFKSL